MVKSSALLLPEMRMGSARGGSGVALAVLGRVLVRATDGGYGRWAGSFLIDAVEALGFER